MRVLRQGALHGRLPSLENWGTSIELAASAPACLPTEQKGMELDFASIERIAS